MTDTVRAYVADAVHDGERLLPGHALLVQGGYVAGVVPVAEIPPDAATERVGSGTIAPGFVDLQVNGGGGVLFNDAPAVTTLTTIAAAHETLGSTALLATLITDTPEQTSAAIEATVQAIDARIPGIAGLHLEGPHLSLARKGAHDPALIRPMHDDDLHQLLHAARRLPTLMVTVAAETVRPDQIRAMAGAGIVVSLGHSDADLATCIHAVEAGARCATHLFNAMSQMGNREPGLVGAVLDEGRISAGLIADGIHVHPATMATALRAKRGPGEIFLVTDAMATAGSAIDGFTLNRRRIERNNGRLTLADGTLAGADLDMATALRVLTRDVGTPIDHAVRMATLAPARVLGRQAEFGRLTKGRRADFVHLGADLALRGVWRNGLKPH
ncbi:MAG: N-acetylglucosamine-6-phosphate deacetylase [Marinibacterium sp.]